MRKLLFSAVAIAALSFSSVADASAQVIKGFYKQSYKARNNGTYDKATSLFSVGLGAPYAYGAGYRSTLPPVYVKYEKAIMDEVGIGVVGGLGMGRFRPTKENYYATSIGVMGYYHFNKFIPLQKLDAYAGPGVGVDISNRNFDGTDVNFVFLFKVGARYYFNNSFGVYVESGYDLLSVANAGITLRF